ncbi:conjugal transfer protein [Streptomyces sp. NPDC005408]|uniref:conjugal transfer protein n=1 Tax=Streptomyces sp. NPDC005408 TaxID=3155341 RepID=UPI0033A8284C
MPIHAPRRPAPAAPSPSPPLRTANASVPALRTAHRRVSLTRIGVWAALAAGPVALAVACAMPRTVVAAAQPKQAAASAVRTADPAGAAALFCDLWLRSDAAQADSNTAQAVHALAPSVALPNPSVKTAQVLQRTVAVRSVRLDEGSWSVVVAAQFTVRDGASRSAGAVESTLVRYFAVPVVATEGASGPGAFTVTAAPAQVAGPGTAKVANSRYVKPLPADSALVSTLGEFFRAHLAGIGEVARYLSPGTELSAVSGSGYTAVRVDQAAADSENAIGAVPGDGTRARVQARITATDATAGTWPLVYTLEMTARSGRWEVTALEAGAPAKNSPEPTSPTTAGGAQ